MTIFLATSAAALVAGAVTYNPGMDDSPSESRIEISWAGCPRWATFQSADLVDAAEQLSGHWVVIFVDVQGSGRGGRRLAATLMRMTREYLAAGLTAETAVTAVHQHLYALRQGKVGASIYVCEVDAASERASIAGLGVLCVAVSEDGDWRVQSLEAKLAGFEQDPGVATMTCEFGPGARLILANDGVAHRAGDLSALLGEAAANPEDGPVAECVLLKAIQRDSGRPRADMAVAAIGHHRAQPGNRILKACLTIPIKRHGSDL